MWLKVLLWSLMFLQMIAWTWIQSRGGKLHDRQYLWFCVGMVLGQIGASIECIMQHTWGTLVVQCFFMVTTIYGGIIRYRQTLNR